MPARDMTRWTQTETGTWRYTPNQSAETVVAAEPEVVEAEVVEAEAVEPEAVESYDYEGMTKAELEEELSSRGLPKYGNKDELIARLTEADNA